MDIQDLEIDIESGLDSGAQALLQVGRSLREISNRRLYRDQGYKTFEAYVADRWEMQRARAYHFIAAADVLEDLATKFDKKSLPRSESALRPMSRLTKMQRIAVWSAALEASKRPGRGIVVQAMEQLHLSTQENEQKSQ